MGARSPTSRPVTADSDTGYRWVVEFDELDRRVVHALQVDGRAGFTAIAAVLGVSDQTVARRYRRMLGAGVLRVAAQVDPWRTGQVRWYFRLWCRPGAAPAVAEALAKRPDTSFIQLVSAGTEVNCVVQVRSPDDRDALLLDKLPRTPQVLSVSAHCLLHMYYGGAAQPPTLTGTLTAEQVAALSPPPPRPTAGRVELTGPDLPLLDELARDGRAGYADLAKAVGWSESAVRRRVEHLRAEGALFFDVDVAPRAIGFDAQARLWLSVAPAELDAVGRAMAGHPEVAFVASTTGRTNLVAAVVCREVSDLHEYVTGRLAGLAGITGMETAPVIRVVKGAAAVF
ncbi:MAG: AsnC family transcriptional regulator [Saccharothrix sp.]|nr:AsnC family transcriptional regulator [Saccharothrix sp.]